MVAPLNNTKKRVPNANELAFIQLASGMRAGRYPNPEDIAQKIVNKRLCEIGIALLNAVHSDGLDGFWKVYESLEIDYPPLREWRQLVEVEAPAEEKKNAAPRYAGRLLSEVKPEKIRWLWKPCLCLGKMTTLDGDPGLGKSLIAASLSASITRGLPMPDGTPCGEPGGVVIIMPEDDAKDTTQPRFARAGANLTKISDLSTPIDIDENGQEYERPFSLSHDLHLLEQEIIRVNAKLVYIDPLMAVLDGDKNTYKDNEVRAMLMPLKMLVERHKVSCIIVRHLTKSRGDNPLMAGGGSVAFIGLARTGLMVVRDQENDQTVLSHIKSNVGKLAPGISYTVVSDEDEGDDRPYVVWGETTEKSGADLLSVPRKNTGGNRHAILETLREHAPDEMTLQEIAEALPDLTMGNLKMTLKRMYEKGEVDKSERGCYLAK